MSRGAADNEQVINSRGGFFFNVLHLHSRLPQKQSAALWSTNECRRLIGHWRASGGALHSLKVVFGHLDQHVAFTCIRSCAINSSVTFTSFTACHVVRWESTKVGEGIEIK